MLISAEVRWFWHNNCPQQLHDWFFKTGLPPGGGDPRTDRYLPQPNEAEISIKKRGDTSGLEVKGLVTTRRSPALAAIASHFEIWCKWSCTIPDLKLTSKMTITKQRWLRQFDTSNPVCVEIPLDSNEKPKSDYALPVQGCNVELTEVRELSRSDAWWTLGFEAFGDLDTAPTNLTRVLVPEKSILTGIVWSGALLSYPGWLLARLAD